MKLHLIRNATMKITYAGRTLLTDPMLSPQGALQSFAGIAPNPTCELPLPVAEVIQGIDGALVTHNHPDHFDLAAIESLPKSLPIFCQPGDEAVFTNAGFLTVTPIATAHTWEGITLTRTGGQHGAGPILEMMGNVSGFVLQASGEPTVYWAGDTIWCDAVAHAIQTFNPDIILTHSGGATIPGFPPILMDGDQTLTLLQAAPRATVVAIHMEALDHCPVTRQGLRQMAAEAGIPAPRLRIPADGEILTF